MGKMSRLGNDLYQGRKSINFVGKPWLWYAVSVVLVALALSAIAFKGLNFGVEFTGGSSITDNVGSGNATQANADKLASTIGGASIANAANPTVTTAGDKALIVQTQNLTTAQNDAVDKLITQQFPQVQASDISKSDIGPSWGKEVADRAGLGVAIFLVLVVIFIWAYFREWKMSAAAIVALVHDCGLTIGVYALSGFEVTPAAVTGLLAILGFSLYDTVVVFDKIKENTTKLRKKTQSYGDAANLAVNQTLVRSINTSIVALIPIGAILWVSAVQLGASTLKDLALAQFVGMGAGVYSSIMLAPRVIVHLKGRESEVKAQNKRAAKAKAKASVDPYASVPAFAEDMPVQSPEPDAPDAGEDYQGYETPKTPRPEPRTSPMGKGRTLPEQHRPVGESSSSGRNQPQRNTRSQRGK
ncbi:MAG: protein translocase subunit SecF [Nocardioidaceae bacterium]|nr:protein translocase subunit SecF [Nocardioidaceae bacterium]